MSECILVRIGEIEEKEYNTTAMLIPLFNKSQQIIGVLQISNSENGYFSKDDEYLGMIISQVISRQIDFIYESKICNFGKY